MVDAVDRLDDIPPEVDDNAIEDPETSASSPRARSSELRCTFCGMTACWSADDEEAPTASDQDVASHR